MASHEQTKLILAIIGVALTLGTLIFGIIKFSREKVREFQKSFYQSQLDIYMQAVDSAASLSVYPRESPEFKKHLIIYRKLFIGQMCIIEDRLVEKRMVQFNQILEWYIAEKKPEIAKILKDQLDHFSLVLAHTCRNSSISTWKLKNDTLGHLFNDYSKKPEKDKKRISICEFLVNGDIQPEDAELNLSEL